MTETATIPLNKLLAWEGNVRKTDPDKGIDELAASIAAHGLLQSLVVRKDKRGKYAVIAGRRRFLALRSLADTGSIAGDYGVTCTVIDTGADATEISLVENVQREAMHPADEFEAFKALTDDGMPVADIAARFGVSETVVQKRLKLARVSPALIAAYRDGEMTLEHVMAFTVSDDQAAQERVWANLPDWRKDDPRIIRDMLTENEITADDRRVKFVTLAAYQDAGGTVRRDLFSEGDEGVFIENIALLEKLAAEKLEETAANTRAEGWKWVEIRASYDHEEWSDYDRRYPADAPLTAEEEAELEGLTEVRDALWDIEEPDAEQQLKLDDVTQRIDAIEDRDMVWPQEVLAIAGAVVNVGHNGEAAIHYGLVRPEDVPETPSNRKPAKKGGGGEASIPASLLESLTAHRSAALNAALISKPAVALAATVHAMVSQLFYSGRHPNETTLQIRPSAQSLHRVEGSPASEAIGAAGEEWAHEIPSDPGELFGWCLRQPVESLLNLLAFCAAQTVNAIVLRNEADDCPRMQHAKLLADAVKLDMTAWFAPTAENYFGKVSKAQIIDALREVKGAVAPAWSDMKKVDLAALAEREIAGTGWLPEPLRPVAIASAQAA